MKLIFDATVPRDDVRTGAIADGDFAARLADAVRGSGSADYAEPAAFFANSYPTAGLKELLDQVCRRLSGAGGAVSAVFRLDTSFGGGKTHALIALVHAARGMIGVTNAAEFIDPKLLPKTPALIAAFDGTDADPANGRMMGDGIRAHTPWGELAYQLGGAAGFERVRASDEQRVAPGLETLRELIGDAPALIVLDELGEYLRKVPSAGGRGQLAAFLKALFGAVESAPNAALVFTLALGQSRAALDAFAEENQWLGAQMAELESVSGRKATNLNPTRDDETIAVLKRRLFASIDPAAAKAAAGEYRTAWAANAARLPADAIRPDAALAFEQSWPFHPDLIATLTEKTATLANFQRVRGMLRVLGKTVKAMWDNRATIGDATAIHAHHVDLGIDSIRREFTTRLQQSGYDPAILHDIAGRDGKPGLAAEIDSRDYRGLLPYAEYAARTIFLNSLAFNNELRFIAPDELRFAILSPKADVAFIDDAVRKFTAESAYLDDRNVGRLRFNVDANLTQIIAREERGIDPEEVRAQLRDRIRTAFAGPSLELVAFPSLPNEIPDDLGENKPRLAVLNHEAESVGESLDEVPVLVRQLYERVGSEGTSIRFKRNNLVFLLADERQVSAMTKAVARKLALDQLNRGDRLAELADHQQVKVREEASKADSQVALAIQQCYRHLLYPSRAGMGEPMVTLAHATVDLPKASESPGKGQQQVLRTLQELNKVRDSGDQPENPSMVRDRTPLRKGQMTLAALREEFRRDPSLPMLLSDEAFRKLILRGIADSTWIYQRGDLLAGPGDPVVSVQIDESSILTTMAYATDHGIWPRQAPKPATTETSGGPGAGGGGSGAPAGTPGGGNFGEATATFGGETGEVTAGGTASAPGERRFSHEGTLKEALGRVFSQARAAGAERLATLTLRLFQPGDLFVLIPLADAIPNATKAMSFAGEVAVGEGTMAVEYGGDGTGARSAREHLKPLFDAATDRDLSGSITFSFESGLALEGAEAAFADKLTKHSAAAAYVEAVAESMGQKE
jgi:hypothetical protein